MKKTTEVKKGVKTIDDSYMSIPMLRRHLEERFIKTTAGEKITLIYTHYLVEQKALPFDWGGNRLKVVVFQGKTYVKISDIIRTRKKPGRKPGTKNYSKGPKTLITRNI